MAVVEFVSFLWHCSWVGLAGSKGGTVCRREKSGSEKETSERRGRKHKGLRQGAGMTVKEQ